MFGVGGIWTGVKKNLFGVKFVRGKIFVESIIYLIDRKVKSLRSKVSGPSLKNGGGWGI